MALTTVRPQGMGFVTGRRNLIINGAMQVAQRGTAATTVSGAGVYDTIDRLKLWESTDGAYTSEQSTEAPDEFSNSVKLAVTTADTSLAATQYACIAQVIEAQNVQHLAYGTNAAKTLTISFYVRSNKTGTYCFMLNKNDSTQYHYVKEFTINSADTWERKTITIAPDSNIKASGGAIVNDNGIGLRCFIGLAWGSTYNGGTDDVWSSNTNHYATSNQVNWMDSTSNNFYFTGFQVEVGENASDFEHRSFGEELSLCQRYFCKSFDIGVTPGTAAAGGAIRGVRGDGSFITNLFFPQEMRAAPTVTMYSPTTGASGKVRNLSGSGSDEASAAFSQGTRNAGFTFTSTSTEVCVNAHFTAEAEL